MSRQLSGEMGFTLVEILVAIAIFGILVTLSYSGMEYVRKHRLQSASRELLSDLQRIRQDAITRSTQNKSGGTVNGRGFGIRFDSNASYQLFEFDDCNDSFSYNANTCPGPPANPSAREEIGNRSKSLSSGITATIGASTSPDSDTHIVLFDRNGIPRQPNWSFVGKTYVLRLAGVDPPRCVSISNVRIREGTWNGSTCVEL